MVVFSITITFLVSCQAKKESTEEKPKTETQKTQTIQPQKQGNIEVSDAEITKFIATANKLRASQDKMRTKLMNMIKESDLGMQKYQAIAQSKRKPNDTTQAQNFTKKELQDFDNLSKEISMMQQKNAEKIVSQEGLTFERYKAISSAARQDSTLQGRLRKEAMKQRPPKKPKTIPNQ